MERTISDQARALLLKYQRDEATDHLIYSRLARREKNADNRRILDRIAADEKEHAAIFARYTGRQVQADRLKVWWYSLMSLLFGYTFIIKLMEKGEYVANRTYYYISVAKSLPFGRRFGEMAVISLGVAMISFAIGLAAKSLLDVDL